MGLIKANSFEIYAKSILIAIHLSLQLFTLITNTSKHTLSLPDSCTLSTHTHARARAQLHVCTHVHVQTTAAAAVDES
jgi:hypothetical protein